MTQGITSRQEPGCAHGIVIAMIYLRITDHLQQRPSEHLAFGKLWENVLQANTAAHLSGFHVQPELSLDLLTYGAGSQGTCPGLYSFSKCHRR